MAGFKWRGKEAEKVARKAVLEALHACAENILTEAIDETPVESGTLRRSGTVTIGGKAEPEMVYEAAETTSQKDAYPSPLGEEDAVYISFNTPYALRQHEELNYSHPLGGKAKYLEDPVNRNASKVTKLVEKRVKEALTKAR